MDLAISLGRRHVCLTVPTPRVLSPQSSILSPQSSVSGSFCPGSPFAVTRTNFRWVVWQGCGLWQPFHGHGFQLKHHPGGRATPLKLFKWSDGVVHYFCSCSCNCAHSNGVEMHTDTNTGTYIYLYPGRLSSGYRHRYWLHPPLTLVALAVASIRT